MSCDNETIYIYIYMSSVLPLDMNDWKSNLYIKATQGNLKIWSL